MLLVAVLFHPLKCPANSAAFTQCPHAHERVVFPSSRMSFSYVKCIPGVRCCIDSDFYTETFVTYFRPTNLQIIKYLNIDAMFLPCDFCTCVKLVTTRLAARRARLKSATWA